MIELHLNELPQNVVRFVYLSIKILELGGYDLAISGTQLVLPLVDIA